MNKEQVAKLFKNKCYVCHKKYGKYFVFHHLWYEVDDIIYRNFKDSKSYNEAFIPYILKNKKRFLLLCRAHHKYVEWFSSIKDKKKRQRFLRAVRMTKT